jgi:hypothetical protein
MARRRAVRLGRTSRLSGANGWNGTSSAGDFSGVLGSSAPIAALSDTPIELPASALIMAAIGARQEALRTYNSVVAQHYLKFITVDIVFVAAHWSGRDASRI